ncbi:HNH endonuclease [Actinoplanes subtropicus]|uniref:HNH endonuclease n=1 Tax=Actinoplanes subtropicus TaxID=543632 RepID=UPI001B8025EB|nr:HNH endonuclease signature motif containing protein [Actinoplanes subtropicus]
MPEQIERLFCSELCRQTAETIRYWRGIVRDGRIDRPDVRYALRTRLAHLLAGGYATRARQLSSRTRQLVWDRDQGRCRSCGGPGEEIDHIEGDSPDPVNLQLLCAPCHRKKTELRMMPASPEQQQVLKDLKKRRVDPDEPVLMCDDHEHWAGNERTLRKERKERLLEELADYGYSRSDFPGYSWAEMWDEVFERDEDDDYEARGIDDDSGFGPDSYFAHAMAKGD